MGTVRNNAFWTVHSTLESHTAKFSDFESAYKQTGMHLGIGINTENFLLGLLHDLYVLHKLMKVS